MPYTRPTVRRVKQLKKNSSVDLSEFPNFHVSGSITGMRKIYGLKALLVRKGSYIYNVSTRPEIYYGQAY